MGALERHLAEIDRCNQRGGRMLSVVDLLAAGTVTADLAAWLLGRIGAGASFMVGASPGGAGKTTVMGALLNFVPPDVDLAVADGLEAISRGLENPDPRRCFICHEISPGRYYSYLWDEPLREYFKLSRAGHMLATNLHADTIREARDQVCGDNGVPEGDFRRMNVAVFLNVGGGNRRVSEVWESDGAAAHRRIYGDGKFSGSVPAGARKRIDALIASESRTIGQVRRFLTVGIPA